MADKVVKLERREYVETETEHRRQYGEYEVVLEKVPSEGS